MSQLRDIKDRIDSVKKTQKITQAMKMVAAAKFKRSSEAAIAARPYTHFYSQLLSKVNGQVDEDMRSILSKKNSSTKKLVIVVTSDKGLCGGFNTNILRFSERFISSFNPGDVSLLLFGNKGRQFFSSKDVSVYDAIVGWQDKMSISGVENYLGPVIKDFVNGEFGEVWLLYNEFQSAVSSNLIKKQLLPLVPDTEIIDNHPSVYTFEPNAEQVLSEISEEMIKLNVYQGFLESVAAEQGARMAAMDSATDNARDMIGALTLKFNRQRQAKITTELSEIVAGAEALVN